MSTQKKRRKTVPTVVFICAVWWPIGGFPGVEVGVWGHTNRTCWLRNCRMCKHSIIRERAFYVSEITNFWISCWRKIRNARYCGITMHLRWDYVQISDMTEVSTFLQTLSKLTIRHDILNEQSALKHHIPRPGRTFIKLMMLLYARFLQHAINYIELVIFSEESFDVGYLHQYE